MTDIELRLSADVDAATRNVGSFRSEWQKLVKEVEKPLRQVNSFRDLEGELEKGARAADEARNRVRDLGNELARTASPSRALQASYKAAAAEVQRLGRVEAQRRINLNAMRADLQAAGLDTRNLAAEQARLRAELSQQISSGAADAALNNARSSLGVGQIETLQRSLAGIRQQYRLVTQSGDLSAKELAEAQATYRRSVDATLAKLRDLRAAMSRTSKSDLGVQSDLAAAFGRITDARSTFGVEQIEAAQRKLADLREQYRLVRDSGVLSSRDIAVAQASYQRQVSDLLAKLRQLRSESMAGANAEKASAQESAARYQRARESINQVAAEQRKATLAARQQAMEAARSDLGINKYRALEGQLSRLEGGYKVLKSSGTLSARELAVAQQSLTQRVRETKREMEALAQQQRRMSPAQAAGFAIGGVASAVGGVYAVKEAITAIAKASDTVKSMDAQLKLSTDSTEEFNTAQAETKRVAEDNRTSLESVTKLYSRLSVPMKDLGRTQGDTVKMIDLVAKSLRISGATAEESASTILQFSQALGSGVLRGEEFNSIAENGQRLLRALADGLNVSVGELRNMAAEGELTGNVIVDALLPQWDQLSREAALLPDTVGGSFQVMKDRITLALGQTDTKPLLDAMKELGDTVSDPQTAANLNIFGAALLKISGALAASPSKFVGTVDEVDYFQRKLSGSVTELQRVDQMISRLQSAKNGLGVLDLWMSDEDIEKSLESYQDYRKKLMDQYEKARDEALLAITGKSREVLEAEDKYNTEMAALREQDAESERNHTQQIVSAKNSQLDATKAWAKAQIQNEKSLLAAVESARKQRLKTEKEYNDAITKLNMPATTGAPGFGDVTKLKVDAKTALNSGDLDKAKQKAKAALDLLLELQDQGANTYGFRGIAEELKQIALSADDIKLKSAQDGLDQVRERIDAVDQAAEKVRNLKITIDLSDAEQARAIDQIQDLAQKMGNLLVLNLQSTPEMQAVGMKQPEVTFQRSKSDNTVSVPAVIEPTTDPSTKEEVKEKAAQLGEGAEVPVKVKPYYETGDNAFTQFPAVEVGTELDQEKVAATKQQLDQFAGSLKPIEVPVIPKYYASADGSAFSQFPSAGSSSAPGYSDGGWTGPGDKYKEVGLVHADEHVQPKRVVNEPGALGFLERVRLYGFVNTMRSLRSSLSSQIRGYASGGLVGGISTPVIPSVADSLASPVAPDAMRPVNLYLEGKRYPVMAGQDTLRDLHREAMKKGHRRT